MDDAALALRMATRARMCDVEELRVTAAFEPCRVHLPPFPPPKAPPRCSVSLVARAIRRLCPRLNFRGLPVRVTSRQRAWCIGGCVQSYGGSQSHRVSERLIRTRCARRPLVPCCQSRRSARRFWRPLTALRPHGSRLHAVRRRFREVRRRLRRRHSLPEMVAQPVQ